MKEIKHVDGKFMVINRAPYHICETQKGMITSMPDELTYEIFDSYESAKNYILKLDPAWVDTKNKFLNSVGK